MHLRNSLIAALACACLTVTTAAQQALQLTNASASNSSYVRIPNGAALTPQQFTLEAWIKPSGNGFGVTSDAFGAFILAKPREGAVGSYIESWALGWAPSTARIYLLLVHAYGSQGITFFSNSSVPIGTSAHIAATFDGVTARLYINGNLDASMAFPYSGVYYGTEDVLIGAGNFGVGYLRRFTGAVDDVRIWDHARDARAIEMLRGCRLTGSESGLLAYYTFNAASVADATGHGHNGTIVGPASAYIAEPVALNVCGSPSQSYCTPGTSTNGCVATLSASGTASVSQTSGFLLTTSNVEGQKFGLLFYGVNGPIASIWAPGSTSVLCVKSPVQRTLSASSGGTAGACNGALAFDFLAFIPANPGAAGAPFTGGQIVRAQTWYRDPPAPGTTNLSNGLCFATAP